MLFGWFNADPGTPGWLIQTGIFASEHLPAAAIVLFLLAAWWRPAWRGPVASALLCALLAWVAVWMFRWKLPMPRPGDLGLGIQWIAQGARSSFPSMHASAAFATAMTLLFTRSGALAAVALPVAALIALSRLYLGLHFPSDVAAGFVLGSVLAALVWVVWRQLASPRRA